jgi:hypothetical protein
MNKIISLKLNELKVEDSTFKGLAPVVCYEPWFPRCLEAIKQCLNDGFPVLIRLHAAANYPAEDVYKLDLESQAVLIVGYDDEKQSIAVVDPWNNNWGGEIGGRRWISYSDTSKQTVNTSLGMAMCLTPPQVQLIPQFDKNQNLSIEAHVGFYSPRGVVMDRESWAIKKITVECILPEGWGKTVSYELAGHWIVGDVIKLSMPITSNPKSNEEIKVLIKADIQGKRPYEFNDCIQIAKTVAINATVVAEKSLNSAVV